MTALARTSSSCKRQTRPLVRESAPQRENCNGLTVIIIWSYATVWCFIPRETGRLTAGRNIRFRLRSRQKRNRLDSGESYRVLEAQPQSKPEERRLGADLLTEFVQGASKRGSVEDFVCVNIPVTF
jgi:hypothetical protein